MSKWYKLNNLGKFYASISNMKPPKVFRYSAYLKENIKEEILQQALDKTLKCYPNFNVNLKRGLFWYFLEESKQKAIVTEEDLPVCFRLYNNSDDLLYRVSYYKKRINFESSHIIADGRGGVEFFKLLVSNYISISNSINIPVTNNIGSKLEKTEDGFTKYFEKTKHIEKEKINPYRYNGHKFKNQTQFLECNMSCKKALELSHKYNTSLSVYFVSALIYSFKFSLSTKELSDKDIVIALPIDLRTFFQSNSISNFFGVVNIVYKFKTKDDTIEDIIQEVSKQFKNKINFEEIKKITNKMVRQEKNWAYRWFPVFIKDFGLSIIKKIENNKFTTNFSNIGKISFCDEVDDKIESVTAMISSDSFQFVACTFKDNFCITISNCYIDNDIIKNYCRYLIENGLDINIISSEVSI